MALFDENYLRKRAKARAQQLHKSTSSVLAKSLSESAKLSSFDIFLSHSYLDAELILAIKESLEDMGHTVYVDWMEDPGL